LLLPFFNRTTKLEGARLQPCHNHNKRFWALAPEVRMKISLRNSSGWRLREAPFPFQQTYATPLTDLQRFVSSLLSPFEIATATICIETIVFTPNDLIAYLGTLGVASDERTLNGSNIQAENASEASTLLEKVLSQWIDFAFIPSPRDFVIYADHDEYTTVFTATAELLISLRSSIKRLGFKEVHNWMWTGPHSQGSQEETTNNV
jgi:hypothetical protein